jgi:hypothetical protein
VLDRNVDFDSDGRIWDSATRGSFGREGRDAEWVKVQSSFGFSGASRSKVLQKRASLKRGSYSQSVFHVKRTASLGLSNKRMELDFELQVRRIERLCPHVAAVEPMPLSCCAEFEDGITAFGPQGR